MTTPPFDFLIERFEGPSGSSPWWRVDPNQVETIEAQLLLMHCRFNTIGGVYNHYYLPNTNNIEDVAVIWPEGTTHGSYKYSTPTTEPYFWLHVGAYKELINDT